MVEDATEELKYRATHLEVPLFAHAKADADKKMELGRYKKTSVAEVLHGTYLERVTVYSTTSWGGRDTKETTVTVTVAVPETPPSVTERGRKALGLFYKTLGEAMSDPKTSDLFENLEKPTLETIWIPAIQSLNVKVEEKVTLAPRPNPDPALLLRHSGRYYLVGLWNIGDELPFEHILREFSVGSVEFPKKDSK